MKQMRTDAIGYHHYHHADFINVRPEGSGDWLMILTHSPACFWIDGEEIPMPAHSLMIYTSDFPQKYTANGTGYLDDWLHFEPDEAEIQLMETLGIPINRPVSLGNVSALSAMLRNMCYEFYSIHLNRQQTVNLYFSMMLYKINELMQTEYSDHVLSETAHSAHLLWIRESIFRWPEQDWNLDALAKEMHLSRSRFQHLYTETFGSTLTQDVINSRMRCARSLLHETDIPLEEVAYRCGYANSAHFSTLFKKMTGVTPKQYRSQKPE